MKSVFYSYVPFKKYLNSEELTLSTKVKIDISSGILEVEGSEEFVEKIYTDFKVALVGRNNSSVQEVIDECEPDLKLDGSANNRSKFHLPPISGHYREASDDYSIKVGDGSIYIKPQKRGLVITAHPASETALATLIGKPTGRDSPNSINYAKWEILK
ncbi:hypothetical protein FT643_22510 [Ketobacter sp. MCCC 1A13808]|uniref:hypothetical protein n=1 Tax=Ketobacter sp. MCCC 1A13808 TaxID=2602738 RepID=UPI0012EC08F6|nr:hypothetical protein [Ketobacter sp. MCCC 1A13808]MVF14912.1 hypothetical protein [Ketobacter sp. MCCC 1A13808]